MSYIIGVDLGQTFEYSAIAVLKQTADYLHEVCHLERHRQTPYLAIIERLRGILGHLPGTPQLAVDATGVGRPVVNLINDARLNAYVYPVTITAGDAVVTDGWEHRIPKRDLVSTVSILLQAGRLRIAKGLSLASVLESELRSFRAKITLATDDTYEAWREGDHDDLVLAVALAAWLGEKAIEHDKTMRAWCRAYDVEMPDERTLLD